jgi:Domain of unknown function (DUF1707)
MWVTYDHHSTVDIPMSTFYIGRMCGHRLSHQHRRDGEYDAGDVTVTERDRRTVTEALGRSWAGGRLDSEEYERRVASATAAASRDDLLAALGDVEPVEPLPSSPRGGWRPTLRTPYVAAAALLAAVAVIVLVGFHPAFFWIVPLVGFKLARFHGRRAWRSPEERTISV